MASNALGGLEGRLKDIDDVYAAHRSVGGHGPGRKWNVEALNRASVLLLCAHFEGFVEDLFSEAFSAINNDLNADPVLSNFHNPWPDRIDEKFATLGMQNPSRRIGWKKASNASVRSNLEDLVRTRNKIAHGVTGVPVSKTDVERYRKYVEGFAKKIDALTKTQVRRITGTNPW